MKFVLLSADGGARRGRLDFARGAVETPAFMPVGTYGTVKGLTPEELADCGAEIVLANSFIDVATGTALVQAHGGLNGDARDRPPEDSGG